MSWASSPEVQARLQAQALLELRKRQAAAPPKRRGRFRDYINLVCPSFPWTPHTTRMVDILQRVADGDLPPRLILQLPPRHYKSTIVSRLFSGWWLREDPGQFVGIGAYGANLAAGYSRAARGYYVASGGALDPSSAAVYEWGTGQTGGMWAVGVDGGATGKGFHLGIVDDPHKDRKEAESPTYRQRVKDWWDAVFYTRREPGAVIIVIQTRWHTDDLVGYLLSKEEALIEAGTLDLAERWHIVDMPALALPANNIRSFPSTCTIEPDHRDEGEALDPERIPATELLKTRANLTARDWESLYQQRPTVASGSVFFKKWFRYHAPNGQGQHGDFPTPEQFIRLILSVDATFKDTNSSDYVAMLLWGQTVHGMFLLDIINQRLSFTDTHGMIRALHPKRPFQEALIEDKANGTAVIDTLKREARGYLLKAVKPIGGKIPRANACTLMFERRQVFLPRLHPMLTAYETQHIGFPGMDYDDMVDATSQALNYVAGTGPMEVTSVGWGYSAGDYAGPDDDDEPSIY